MLTKEGIRKAQQSFEETDSHLAFIFQTLGDATRLKMFQLLSRSKGLCVTDIANVFHISVPAASYQLKFMEVTGLVKRERMGKMICYELRRDNPLLKSIIRLVS
ncbi:MAG: winged helix-turn-helix transcriptional regulator [Candidatus Wildermuthbacteria bacterium]|nr:winged helix-turn-helix transcriptional regulator [Candidatus Wildermuthbacteria bacterium]